MQSNPLPAEPIPHFSPEHLKDLQRIGYLEECLRHIDSTVRKKGDPYVRLSQVRALVTRTLQAGDPLTCPEARRVKR